MPTEGGGYGGAVDCISSLPDNLLHSILLRLPDTAEAARTSILARRWRTVWTDLPELSFEGNGNIDAALAAHTAPIVNRLEIIVNDDDAPHIPSERISSWLLFASQRLAGELHVSLDSNNGEGERDVVLPLCERATAIIFNFIGHTLRFRLPPAAAFSALATLVIAYASLHGYELEGILCSGCPRLKELVLKWITLLNGAPVICIRSNSLQRLQIRTILPDTKLEVVAPELQAFGPCSSEFTISASPKLSEVDWSMNRFDYDPSYQCFGVAGCHLRRLAIRTSELPVQLMQRFHTVDELDMNICAQGIVGLEKFLEDIKMLSKCCDVLVLRLREMEHGLKPLMLYLLRKCAGIRKLVVQAQVNNVIMDDYPCNYNPWLRCSYDMLENRKRNNIVLNSLEGIEVNGSYGTYEIVSLLCEFSTTFQKRVTITVSGCRSKAICEKIRSIQPPNNKVGITVLAP